MARITIEDAMARISMPSITKKSVRSTAPALRLINNVRDDVLVVGSGERAYITPMDDNLPAIIGETDNIGDELPPAMADWLEVVADEVERSIEEDYHPELDYEASATTRESVSPLVKSKWSQWSPFNNNLDGSPTGCCATAVAQVMYYWGVQGVDGKVYHRGCMATNAYKTETTKKAIAALPPITVFDYKHLSATTPTSELGKQAVATMLEYIGKAMKSNYKESSTSAWTGQVYYALHDYLRMGKCNMMYSALMTAEAFEEKVYKEIASKRPIVMSGSKATGGGHCFVCDGYNAVTDKYHFNWGWGGQYDGWYALSALNVTSKIAYNSNKIAFTVAPQYVLGDADGNGDITIMDVMKVANDAANGTYSERSDVNSDGTVSVDDVNKIANHILGKEEL